MKESVSITLTDDDDDDDDAADPHGDDSFSCIISVIGFLRKPVDCLFEFNTS